jgi:hypothetical protein
LPRPGSATARSAGIEPRRADSPRWSILCGVDGELAAIELSIVKQPDRLERVRIGRELDEGKAPRGTSLAIGRQVHFDDAAGLGQKLRQGLRRRPSVQIPDEDTS